jgi:ankyrin repeat protein
MPFLKTRSLPVIQNLWQPDSAQHKTKDYITNKYKKHLYMKKMSGDISELTTQMFAAVESNNCIGVLECLLNGVPVDCTNVERQTPLMRSTSRNFPDIVALLVNHGAHINAHDQHNMTPLYHAIAAGAEDCVDFLLRLGAKSVSNDSFLIKTATATPPAKPFFVRERSMGLVNELEDDYPPVSKAIDLVRVDKNGELASPVGSFIFSHSLQSATSNMMSSLANGNFMDEEESE